MEIERKREREGSGGGGVGGWERDLNNYVNKRMWSQELLKSFTVGNAG